MKLQALLSRDFKQQIKTRLGVSSTERTLREMRARGFAPRAVLDIGAYVGAWTRECKDIFPTSRVMMFEPQADKRESLQKVAQLPNVHLRSVLLGARERSQVGFHFSETTSSVLSEGGQSAPETSLPMTTLDVVTRDTSFARPDLIKVDVQGYELEVLRGGEETLSHAQAVLMEVNLLPIIEGAPLLHESVEFMAARGFRAYDVCEFIRRPYDGAVWQMDMMFVRDASPLLAHKGWN